MPSLNNLSMLNMQEKDLCHCEIDAQCSICFNNYSVKRASGNISTDLMSHESGPGLMNKCNCTQGETANLTTV